MNKKGLGKGLSALIPMSPDLLGKDEPATEIDLSLIKPNPFQPRRTFEDDKLSELAASIKEHGLVQPVIVRPVDSGKYELVVGERRLRACQKLMLETIPAIVKELSNQQMMEIALIENLQRQDLNPVEEATAYKRLMEEFHLTQEQVAQRLSKSRSLIANMVRILNLPSPILEQVAKGQLTVGHVRPLLTINHEEAQIKLAQEIIDKNLTARDSEILAKKYTEEKQKPIKKKDRKDDKLSPTILDLEARLRSICGTKVKIKDLGDKGRIEIDYYSADDLERIMSLFLKDEINDANTSRY